ncbi:MAG TPA: GNAT family N-acetyltransferase [Bryobacteraceae bacterium]|nr:GNAT family N-acetyltransferase [Bryobacteraceae bacterium]
MIATGTVTTPDGVEELEHFLARHGRQGYTPWHQVATSDRVEALAAQRTRTLLMRESTHRICWRNDFETTGLACWTELAWDSEQFGFPAARVDLLVASGDRNAAAKIKRDLVAETLLACGNRGIRHTTARVDAADQTSMEALRANQFDLIDGIQTFSIRMPLAAVFPKESHSFELRLFRESDLPQVRELARASYIHDRFHADSAIDTATADRINETWVMNCCLGHMADAVVIASAGDRVLGYVTCRVDKEATRVLGIGCGEIGMVATAASARNGGVASAATMAALEWFSLQGVSFVEVGTQLRNIAAARLYERCGFRLASASLTWRRFV